MAQPITITTIWDETSAYGDVILEADETDTTIAEYTLANRQLVSKPVRHAKRLSAWQCAILNQRQIDLIYPLARCPPPQLSSPPIYEMIEPRHT